MSWYSLVCWGVVAIAAALCLRVRMDRSCCLRRLSKRGDVDLESEITTLAENKAIPAEDLRRLWTALADAYGIPANKIRAQDRLNGELRGAQHPDHDPFLTGLFLHYRDAFKEHIGHIEPKNWGDLVAAMRAFEEACGESVTVVSEADGLITHVWRQ